jgi:hypothetical protein
MPQQQEVQYQPQPVEERRFEPRYGGGGGGGGGERRGGPKEYGPEEVSEIFRLLKSISEKYFRKASSQPIPEEVIRDLHIEVFGAIAQSTADKEKLLKLLRSMSDQADAERLERDSQLSATQMSAEIRKTMQKIKDCFFPEYPE